MSDRIRSQIEQARQALDDARGAREAGLSDAVVVNRLYYACFHAAKAALLDRDLDPDSHGGVLSLFGSEIVAEGDASRDHGRFLNELSTLRKRADYGYEPIDRELDPLFERAEEFLKRVESIVDQ